MDGRRFQLLGEPREFSFFDNRRWVNDWQYQGRYTSGTTPMTFTEMLKIHSVEMKPTSAPGVFSDGERLYVEVK